MSEPQIIVIRDHKDDNDAPIAVYVNGKRLEAKVLGWWSDDSNEDNVLSNHWWRTCCTVEGGESYCTEEGEYRLPDEWSGEEWAALVGCDRTTLPPIEPGQ